MKNTPFNDALMQIFYISFFMNLLKRWSNPSFQQIQDKTFYISSLHKTILPTDCCHRIVTLHLMLFPAECDSNNINSSNFQLQLITIHWKTVGSVNEWNMKIAIVVPKLTLKVVEWIPNMLRTTQYNLTIHCRLQFILLWVLNLLSISIHQQLT